MKLESLPIAAVRLDNETRILAVSEVALALLGVSSAELVGTSLRSGPITWRAELRALVARALAGETVTGIRMGAMRKNGDPLQLEVSVSPTRGANTTIDGAVIIAVDRTGDAAAHQALERSETRYRKLFERNLAGTYRTTLDGRIIDCNDEFVRIFGFASRADALARGASELYFHADDRTALMSRLESTGSFTNEPVRLRRRDGTEVWVLKSEMLVRDEAGAAVLDGILSDITERRNLEQQLVLAERLVALGTLAAGIAHEINNPMTYVVTNVDLALAVLAPEAATSDAALESIGLLREAAAGAERVRSVVRDLERHYRGDATEPLTQVDLAAALDSALEFVKHDVRHRARISKRYEKAPPVRGRATRIGQVLVNLLANASRAMANGGPEHNELALAIRTDARGWAVLEVADTGAGIEAAAKERIFDPFFTTYGDGHGLGLAICRGIVTELGGEISVESEVGRGSVFRVSLPAAGVSSTPPAGVRRQSSSPVPDGHARVLVIDDEPAIVRALRRCLRDDDVTGATGGREALEHVQAGAEFDVVLCDLMMPDLDGPAFFRALSEVRPDLAARTIFVTGGAVTPQSQEFLEGLGRPWVRKPFKPEEVRRAVAEMRRAAQATTAR